MTIAAGFVTKDGVLLCADTQHESWGMKIHRPKIGSFECPGGRVAFALAGNAAFALSAMQKCEHHLKSVPPEEMFDRLCKTLDKEYRRNVLSHPGQSTDPNLHYQFVLSVWTPCDGVALFVTYQTTVREVDRYECVGVGEALAQFLLSTAYSPDMDENQALIIASYALASVKDYVPGCGGRSQYLSLHRDGKLSPVKVISADQIEKYVNLYDIYVRSLLTAMADLDLPEDQFEQVLNGFIDHIKSTRKMWVQERNLPRFVVQDFIEWKRG